MTPALPAAALILLAAGEASAQSRPQLIPTRDVDITYRVTQSGRSLEERVRWLGGAALERVDPPGPIYMIVDHKAHRLALVDTSARTVLDLEAPKASALHPDISGAWTRIGQSTVAGLACAEWRLAVGAGEPEQLCAAADGVLLRVLLAGRPIVQAVSVRYRRLDPKTFQMPADYRPAPPTAAPPPDTESAAPEP